MAIENYFMKISKVIFIVSLLSIFAGVDVKANNFNGNSINVVEISNFFCPYCYRAHLSSSRLKEFIINNAGIYDFVPISWGDISPWPAIIYLRLTNPYNGQLVDGFFQAIHNNGLQIQSALSACVLAHDVISTIEVNSCIADYVKVKAETRLKNAWTLISKLKLNSYNIKLPLYIVERNNKIIKVFFRRDDESIESLLNNLLNYVKNCLEIR